MFNNAQRAHYNYLEAVVPALSCLLISGLAYPTVAAGLGAVYIVGRLVTVGSGGRPERPAADGRCERACPNAQALTCLRRYLPTFPIAAGRSTPPDTPPRDPRPAMSVVQSALWRWCPCLARRSTPASRSRRSSSNGAELSVFRPTLLSLEVDRGWYASTTINRTRVNGHPIPYETNCVQPRWPWGCVYQVVVMSGLVISPAAGYGRREQPGGRRR